MVAPRSDTPLMVWRIVDGKPGHDNQSWGLVKALSQLEAVERDDIDAVDNWRAAIAGLLLYPRISTDGQRPDLIVCAGHRTHLTALAARRQHGGRIVTLMKPSLPLGWFDLCLVPEHDNVRGPNVVATKGALNNIEWRTDHDPDQGLILLGGPSRHAGWSTENICQQVAGVVRHDDRQWTVASSRRTPDATLQALEHMNLDSLRLCRWQDVSGSWLRDQLAVASVIWVSEDSVSMIYEALSSGATCGLLGLPGIRPTRVMAGIAHMVDNNALVYVNDWLAGKPLPTPREPVDEARRCARLILQNWFTER